MKNYLNKALAGFRQYHDLTKVALARKLGVESKVITAIEDGEMECSEELLKQYANVFGVFINDFRNLATAFERALPKAVDGNVADNHRKNAERAIKSDHAVTQSVFARELVLLKFKVH